MHQTKLWVIQMGKYTVDVFIQHHWAVQPLTAIPWPDCLYRQSLCYRKVASKVDHLSVACFEYEVLLYS